jgi:hypothetical protein
MSSTVEVPPNIVPHMRDALQIGAGRAAEAISAASERLGRMDHGEWFLEPRVDFEQHAALLDVIGWDSKGSREGAKIDLDQHRVTLVEALREHIKSERHFIKPSENAEDRRASEQNVAEVESWLAEAGLKGKPVTDPHIIEEAIVVQLLRDDHDERWSRADLETELWDVEPSVLGDALERLWKEGVVHWAGEQVSASRYVRYLHALGMVSC